MNLRATCKTTKVGISQNRLEIYVYTKFLLHDYYKMLIVVLIYFIIGY